MKLEDQEISMHNTDVRKKLRKQLLKDFTEILEFPPTQYLFIFFQLQPLISGIKDTYLVISWPNVNV